MIPAVYVYAKDDGPTYTPIYVGQTKHVAQRLDEEQDGNGGKDYLTESKKNGANIIIIFTEDMNDEQHRLDVEKELIFEWRKKGFRLLNKRL
jgi:predicted GIY-YIG superfamily endonuclease